jgi:hypothetical protein
MCSLTFNLEHVLLGIRLTYGFLPTPELDELVASARAYFCNSASPGRPFRVTLAGAMLRQLERATDGTRQDLEEISSLWPLVAALSGPVDVLPSPQQYALCYWLKGH